MNKKASKNVVVASTFVMIAAIVALVLVITFKTTETHTSPISTTTSTTALNCTGISLAEPFFTSDAADTENHNIKVIFNDNSIDKMSYTYTGTFPDDEAVKTISSILHAKYNLYMDKTSTDFSSLSPNFSTLNQKLVISLFFDSDKVTSETAPLLFLSANDITSLGRKTPEELQKLYQNKGFSCNIIK